MNKGFETAVGCAESLALAARQIESQFFSKLTGEEAKGRAGIHAGYEANFVRSRTQQNRHRDAIRVVRVSVYLREIEAMHCYQPANGNSGLPDT